MGADEVRGLNQMRFAARKPATPNHAPVKQGGGFPRAAFGLPIIFHFKDYSDPEDNTLNVVGSEADGKNTELRLASPLIVKPWAIASANQAVPLLLALNTQTIEEQAKTSRRRSFLLQRGADPMAVLAGKSAIEELTADGTTVGRKPRLATYLLAISIGPVQDFIAAARRCRDLWRGSDLLSELSRVVAEALLKNGATLVFPAADSASVLSEMTVANKILAKVGSEEIFGSSLVKGIEGETREAIRQAISVEKLGRESGLGINRSLFDWQLEEFLGISRGVGSVGVRLRSARV